VRVLFVTQYGSMAASSRTRVLQYLPYLQQQGLGTHVITILPDGAIAGSQIDVRRQPLRKICYYLWAAWRTWSCGLRVCWGGFRHDILFIQKVILPSPLRWLLRWISAPIVYDFDDAIFTTEIRSGHWLARWKEARNACGLPAMLALASYAVVENDYTGEFAGRFCPILTITGPIDIGPYEVTPTLARPDADGVVLGWIGSGTTVAYLDRVRGTLQKLAAQFPRLRLLVIGAEWSAAGVDVECRPWSLEHEASDLAACDIGIMPVADDLWTRGKGGYKLLQYMAAGLPVVTDPVGINAEIVVDGQSGYLVHGEQGWAQALHQLIEDADLRRRLGAFGRQRVHDRFAQHVQQDQLLAMLRQVAGVAS